MRRYAMISLALMGMLLAASAAWAQVDVDLAFSPDAVAPGDEVTVFFSIANLGDEAVIADVALDITFGDQTFPTLLGKMPLPAGYECSKEMTFVVPPLPYSGDLTVTVTVTAGEFTDSATDTITILEGEMGAGSEGVQEIGRQLLDGMGANAAVPAEAQSMGQLKSNFQ